MIYKKWKFLAILVLAANCNNILAEKNVFNNIQYQSKIFSLADKYIKIFYRHHPEVATIGYEDNPSINSRLTDNTPEGVKAWYDDLESINDQIQKIDKSEIGQNNINNPDYIVYKHLSNIINSELDTKICKKELWNVYPSFQSWQTVLNYVSEKQPVGSKKNREDALKRWKSLPIYLENEIKNLRAGLKYGYSAPSSVVPEAIAQLDELLSMRVEQSPFYNLAKRDKNALFQREFKDLLKNEIYPAIAKYKNFLEDVYIHHARKKIGLSAHPNGKQCYKALIKKNLSLNITPKEIYNIGLSEVDNVYKELEKIQQKSFKMIPANKLFTILENSPKYKFEDSDEIVEYSQKAYQRAKDKIQDWFYLMPKSKAKIVPYPNHIAKKGATGEYHDPSNDGKQPGIFYINTYNPTDKNKLGSQALLFHELIPGHYYQNDIARQKAPHKIFSTVSIPGFNEGWALYTESLASEMGLYSTDIDEIGRLASSSFRAARLVLDSGIHSFNWDKNQALKYIRKHTTLDNDATSYEINRYIMNPGQAITYKLGAREIMKLRQKAKSALGSNFDIRKFHDVVLSNGSISLDLLSENVDNWIAQNNN